MEIFGRVAKKDLPKEMSDIYRKFISAFQMLNILFQALYSLVLPIGIGALVSFLLTRYASAPKWIWVVLLVIGTFAGLYSMIKFILTATAGLERMEKQRNEADAEKRAKEQLQARLNSELCNKESEGDE